MTSRPYHFSYHTSFTIILPGDIVALGDLIRVEFGGIAENWHSQLQPQRLDRTQYQHVDRASTFEIRSSLYLTATNKLFRGIQLSAISAAQNSSSTVDSLLV